MDKTILDLYIKQIALGDRDSFHKLYEYAKKPIFLFALSIVKNRQAAEDILQETMLRVAFNSEKYRLGTNPKAWLLSITRNLCNDVLRLPSSHDLPLAETDFFLESKNDLAKSIEEIDEILSALQILSHQEREIVSLYIYAGFSQVEIAKILQISYVRVRSQYKYALKKLRTHFEKRSESL